MLLNFDLFSFGAAESVAGGNIIASEPDKLFRSDRVPVDPSYRRAEAARILLKSPSSHSGIPDDDRRYLVRMASSARGMSPDEAEQRVDSVIALSAQELHRARIPPILQAFFVGAALLIGAAVAWFAACEGGRDREGGRFPAWRQRAFPRP